MVGGCEKGCVVGGGSGGELINLPSAKTVFSAAMLLWDEDDISSVVFHSVIFNSVTKSMACLWRFPADVSLNLHFFWMAVFNRLQSSLPASKEFCVSDFWDQKLKILILQPWILHMISHSVSKIRFFNVFKILRKLCYLFTGTEITNFTGYSKIKRKKPICAVKFIKVINSNDPLKEVRFLTR